MEAANRTSRGQSPNRVYGVRRGPVLTLTVSRAVQLAKANGVKAVKTGNPYYDIARISRNLAANNIEYNVRYENGKKYKDHWRAETKGLDDYLYMLQEQHVS